MMNTKFYLPFLLSTGLLMACSSGSSSGGGGGNVSNECVETTPLDNGSIQVRNVCDFEINIGRITQGRLKDITPLRRQQTTIEFEEFEIIACQAPQVPVSADSCAG